jgi:serine/threonine protein kinase
MAPCAVASSISVLEYRWPSAWCGPATSPLRCNSLHIVRVIHGDVKPENILLDESGKAYPIDFSGSCVDEEQGSAFEGVRFCMPRSWEDDSTVQTDLFALGPTLYEIMTGTQPYRDLEDDVVEAKFKQGEFPSVDSLLCGRVILQCWESTVGSADDVHKALQAIISVSCLDR